MSNDIFKFLLTVCCMLHNIARHYNLPDPEVAEPFVDEDNNPPLPERINNITERARTQEGKNVRADIIQRFFARGQQ